MLVNPYTNATAAEKRRWRARNWCFTLNNPTSELIADDVARWSHVNQAAWQLEMGEQGTPHYQGYVTFTEPMRLGAVRALDETTEEMHWEPRWRSHNQCLAYVTKEDRLEGPFFYPDRVSVMGVEGDRGLGRGRGGPRGGQGHRTDLQAVADALHAGVKIREIAVDFTTIFIKHANGISRAAPLIQRAVRNADRIDSVLYLGITRTGKSYRLRQECPPGDEWYWHKKGKWFDDYEGQPGIVFDEFRDSWMPYEDFLRLVDGGPLMVEVKRDFVQILATKFRFSSNVHPEDWWPGAKQVQDEKARGVPWKQQTLARRFTRIEYMNEQYDAPDLVVCEENEEDKARFKAMTARPAPVVHDEQGVPWARLDEGGGLNKFFYH